MCGMHDSIAAKLILRFDTLGEFEGIEGDRIVTRVSQAVLVDVDGMGQTQVLVGLDETGDDLGRCDIIVRDRIVDAKAVKSPCPCRGATRIDEFYTVSLGRVDDPRHVGSGVLDLVVLQVLHHKPVIRKDGEGSLVNDRGVVDLLMHVGRMKRGHGSLHHKGVPHPGIVIPGLEGARDGESHLHAVVFLGIRALEELVLRPHQAAGIHFWPGDVGVDIDGPGHDHFSLCIDYLGA